MKKLLDINQELQASVREEQERRTAQHFSWSQKYQELLETNEDLQAESESFKARADSAETDSSAQELRDGETDQVVSELKDELTECQRTSARVTSETVKQELCTFIARSRPAERDS